MLFTFPIRTKQQTATSGQWLTTWWVFVTLLHKLFKFQKHILRVVQLSQEHQFQKQWTQTSTNTRITYTAPNMEQSPQVAYPMLNCWSSPRHLTSTVSPLSTWATTTTWWETQQQQQLDGKRNNKRANAAVKRRMNNTDEKSRCTKAQPRRERSFGSSSRGLAHTLARASAWLIIQLGWGALKWRTS